jgi:HEAT repeat protein
MIENFSKLTNDIEFGTELDAFEAAKVIANNSLSKKEIGILARITKNGNELHNMEAATYALSWIENGNSSLSILINLLETPDIHESVRGQAAEGIGIINPSRRNKNRQLAETTLIENLGNPSPTVRFWSCYAVGQMKLKNALPILKELKKNDHIICPNWWYVSEEAADAIEWINGRFGENRVPVNDRNRTEPSASRDAETAPRP